MASNECLQSRWYTSDVDFYELARQISPGDLLELAPLSDDTNSSWLVVVEAEQVIRLEKSLTSYTIVSSDLSDVWEKRKLRINNENDAINDPFSSDFQLFCRIAASRGIYENPSLYGVSASHEHQFAIWIRNKHWEMAPLLPTLPSNREWRSEWIIKSDEKAVAAFRQKLSIGDLIEFSRGSYNHWAVYIGSDHVIHLKNMRHPDCGINSISARVSGGRSAALFSPSGGRILMQELMANKVWQPNEKARCNNSNDSKEAALAWFHILNNAVESIMFDDGDVYSLTRNNCEHFVTRMRYDRAASKQVRRAVKKGVGFIVGIIILVLTLVLCLVYLTATEIMEAEESFSESTDFTSVTPRN